MIQVQKLYFEKYWFIRQINKKKERNENGNNNIGKNTSQRASTK